MTLKAESLIPQFDMGIGHYGGGRYGGGRYGGRRYGGGHYGGNLPKGGHYGWIILISWSVVEGGERAGAGSEEGACVGTRWRGGRGGITLWSIVFASTRCWNVLWNVLDMTKADF